jgi:hypothetical protein
MNKDKFIIVIEYAWILMAVFCLIAGIYYHSKIGISRAWMIYAMSVISLGMFGVRRMQRKNAAKRQNRFK